LLNVQRAVFQLYSGRVRESDYCLTSNGKYFGYAPATD